MQTVAYLKSEREVKIIRAIIEELKAENQMELLIIRIVNQSRENCVQTTREGVSLKDDCYSR